MLRVVSIHSSALQYTLHYKKVKNINLRIKADGSVHVSAPPQIEALQIDAILAAKAESIIMTSEKFKLLHASRFKQKNYENGESIRFLGKNLSIVVASSPKNEIYWDGTQLLLNVRDSKDIGKKQRLVEQWIKQRTLEVFDKILKEVHKDFIKYGIALPQMRIRKMSTMWGSCRSTRRIITMNSRLIEAPISCIEYVMVHEFCHFIHPNHSKHFYALLQIMMPDWKERKTMLEETFYKI